MHNLDDLCEQIVDKKKHLKELEETSPEAALALKVEGEYQELLQELKDRVERPTYVPVPYPYPTYPTIIYVNPPTYPTYPFGYYQPSLSSGHTTITWNTNATACNTL